MYQYAYLSGALILGMIWLFLFLKRKDLRHEQLFVSFLTAPLAPITQVLWFYNDYWRPEYFFTFYINEIPLGIEEVLFSFFVGGIGSISYEFFMNRKHRMGKKNHTVTLIGVLSVIITFLILKYVLLSTVWASFWALVLTSIVLVKLNRKLSKDMFISGLIMLLIAFVTYVIWLLFFPEVIDRFWVSDGLSGLNILKIPVEELSWFLAWGMFSGIIYESWVNIKSYPVLAKRKS